MSTPILTQTEMLIRLVLGFTAGALIGFERASRRQVAGLRTHILICEGATLLMILSIWVSQEYVQGRSGDPGRIAAQVVSGIGFLGAGAIIRLGNNVRGLTTAASIWLVSAVGLTIGAGLYTAAGIALLISLFTLVAMDRLENRLFPSERNKILDLSFRGQMPDAMTTKAVLESFGVRVLSIDLDHGIEKGGISKLRFLIGFPNITDLQKLTEALNSVGTIERIEIKEKY